MDNDEELDKLKASLDAVKGDIYKDLIEEPMSMMEMAYLGSLRDALRDNLLEEPMTREEAESFITLAMVDSPRSAIFGFITKRITDRLLERDKQ